MNDEPWAGHEEAIGRVQLVGVAALIAISLGAGGLHEGAHVGLVVLVPAVVVAMLAVVVVGAAFVARIVHRPVTAVLGYSLRRSAPFLPSGRHAVDDEA